MWKKILIIGLVCVVRVMALVVGIPISTKAQYDSLSEIRSAVRSCMNMGSATLITDADLNRMINIAARQVQVDIKAKIDIDTVVMSNVQVRYQLNSDAMHGDVSGVVWKKALDNMEVALVRIREGEEGKAYQGAYPAYYRVVGDWLVISKQAVEGDTLFVYYPPRTTEMTGDNDTAGLDEADDAGVIYLTCSFVAASRHKYQLMQFWGTMYIGFKNSRLGVRVATR